MQGKAGAHQFAGKAAVGPGTVEKQVKGTKIEIVATGHPGGFWIHGHLSALDHLRAGAKGIVGPAQVLHVHYIVRIEYHKRVVALPFQLAKGLAQGVALLSHWIVTGQDLRPRLKGCARRVVGTVVGRHIHIEQLTWIVLLHQALYQAADNSFLISGGDDYGKAGARSGLRPAFPFSKHPPDRYRRKIHRSCFEKQTQRGKHH